MRVYSAIVEDVAKRATARAVRLVMRRMREVQDARLSGEDSELANAWEEVCVQVQGEHSFYWSAYLATMKQFAVEAADRMSYHDWCAVWLQTDDGRQWVSDIESGVLSGDTDVDHLPRYCAEDVAVYITDATCDLAASWSNPRIRAYAERSLLT